MSVWKGAAVLFPAALVALSSAAPAFPVQPIRLVIPFAAGGASDLTARTFIDRAPDVLGQPIVLQMRPGGGGAVASRIVASARPDGYTLLLGHTNSNSLLPAIEGRSVGPGDLLAVCRIGETGSMFVAATDAPFASFTDMIRWARAHPGALTVSTIGTWSAVGFTWKRMERDLGITLRLVSFDGGAEALLALLGGHVHASLLALPQSLPHIRAGRLRALAWSGPARHRDLPSIPTAGEQGFAHTLSVFKGIMAPKGTPRPVIDRLAAAFQRMLETPRAIESIRRLGDEVHYLGPDEFERYWRAEYERFQALGRIFKR